MSVSVGAAEPHGQRIRWQIIGTEAYKIVSLVPGDTAAQSLLRDIQNDKDRGERERAVDIATDQICARLDKHEVLAPRSDPAALRREGFMSLRQDFEGVPARRFKSTSGR
jgi:hypothetical protein